jgi:acyl-CoA thioester hydrolase
MLAGVLEMGESEARLLQLLIHSGSGELAAVFQTVVAHVTAKDGRIFPWSGATRRRANVLKTMVPEQARPRSLSLDPGAGGASLAEADRLDLIRLGAGAVGPADCDIFGRMRPDVFVGRVSDGVPALGAALRKGRGTEQPAKTGGAVLEYRVCYQAWPRAGDRFEIRSGLAGVDDRTQRLAHWLLDPDTGHSWGTAEAVAVALDLEARRIVPISPEDQAHLRGRITPGLSL